MDSDEGLKAELARRRAEKAIEQQALFDALALLKRVDEQRRLHPSDRRRWDRRADRLEDALDEARRRVNWLEPVIRDLERRIQGRASSAETPAGEIIPFGPRIDPSLGNNERQAAERVFGAPVFKLETLSLEDFALAKAFLGSDEAQTWPRDRREELRRRIAVYDRKVEREFLGAKPRLSPEERRKQVLLRLVLDKCRAGAYAQLTLGEIDLLINSYELLVQKPEAFDEEDRLFDLINRAVDEVCERWVRMQPMKGPPGPES